MAIINTWWPEKYRPKTLEQYAGNEQFIEIAKEWIKRADAPSFIAYSPQSGTGKTTICRIIANALDAEVMEINGSKDNNIETVRDKITQFASGGSFSRWKILIINEFSYFTPNAQSALLDIIESSSASTRFFLTGNYIEKFLPAIVSRCQPYLIQSPAPKKIFENLSAILATENVAFEPNDVVRVIKAFYPDQRQMLNYLQSNSINGKFSYQEETAQTHDYCKKVIDVLKSNSAAGDKYTQIRQLFADAKVRQFDDLFTTLYSKLDDYAPVGRKATVISAIAEGQYRSTMVVDKEIQAINCINDIINAIK